MDTARKEGRIANNCYIGESQRRARHHFEAAALQESGKRVNTNGETDSVQERMPPLHTFAGENCVLLMTRQFVKVALEFISA